MSKAFSILTAAAAFAVSGCVIIVDDDDDDDDRDYEFASAMIAEAGDAVE